LGGPAPNNTSPPEHPSEALNRRQQPPALRLITLLVFVFSASACASMQKRVTESENRSNTLEAQVSDLQENQQNLISHVASLQTELEAALDPIRVQQAGEGAELRALEAQVSALREQVKQLTTALAQSQSTEVALPSKGRLLLYDFFAPPKPSGLSATAGEQPTSTGDFSSYGDEEEGLFNRAYADYTAGQFVVAVSGFEEFLARHSTSSRAPDALYWIAESLSAQGLHIDARNRFLKVKQNYPASVKVSDATLSAALEAIALGEHDTAIRELRDLIATHAGTDAALIGCMQLDRLSQSLPVACQVP